MQATTKKLSDTKVQLTIQLGSKELEDAEQVALAKLSRDVKVPGFRKGKAPVSQVAKHVNPEALANQTLDNALSKAVSEAFTKDDIRALDRPQVEVKKFVPGKELEFTAEVEIYPEVKLGDYKKLKAKREEVKVTKVDVDEIIERIRTSMADRKTVDRAAKDGDEVVVDFVGKKDGTPFDGGTAKDYSLKLGAKQFIPGFEEGIVGHKAGDEFDLDLEFPKEYRVEGLAGAKVVFSVKLNEVKEMVLPPADDELAKKAGDYKTLAILRETIESELKTNRQAEVDEQYKNDLVKDLVEKSTIPVPAILLNDQIQMIERDMVQNLSFQGLTLDGYLKEKSLDKATWIQREVTPAALARVQSSLALAEISKTENITASQDELAAKTNEMQQQYGSQGANFSQPEHQQQIANRILTEKTLDKLVELNT